MKRGFVAGILSAEQSINDGFLIKTELETLTYFSMELTPPYLNSIHWILHKRKPKQSYAWKKQTAPWNLFESNYFLQVCNIAMINQSLYLQSFFFFKKICSHVHSFLGWQFWIYRTANCRLNFCQSACSLFIYTCVHSTG